MNSIRVAIVASEGVAGRGGIGRVTAYLVRELDAGDQSVQVTVHRSRYSERPIIKHLTVPFALMNFAVAARRADLVHLNIAARGSTWRKMVYAWVAARLGKPVLLHLHGSGYDEYYAKLGSGRQAAIRNFYHRAAGVVALSDYWKRFLTSAIGLDPAKVTIIHNGVPSPEAAIAKDRGNVPLIAFAGMVGHRKGIDVLLAALAQVKGQGLPFRVVIGGNGEVADAQARAVELGVAEHIIFAGWLSEADVDALLQRAEIFVLPSRAENQPVAILEAMARGAAVVASDVGAIPEQVLDGETGLLVKPGDADALAAALATLIRSPELRTRYGAAGRERFDRYFSVEPFAQDFARLYRDLAAAGMK